MNAKWIKRGIGLLVAAGVIAAGVYAMMPAPVGVDIATIDRGVLEVTVDEEGVARIRDIFKVSTPVAGRVERLPIKAGDGVQRAVSTVAMIRPADPPFLDVRTRRELEAGLEAARAAVVLADEQRASADSRFTLARSNHERAEKLVALGRIPERSFQESETALATAEADLRQAEANLAVRRSELAAAEARLIGPDPEVPEAGPDVGCMAMAVPTTAAEARLIGPDFEIPQSGPDSGCVTVTSPIDGVVLNLQTESEQVLPAGAPLAEVGDPANLEIVADLLSSDAVKVTPGMTARIGDWGGGTLSARVTRVNPSAYTKTSALGIEEQRVDVLLELVDPREAWERLGHEFRVMIHIPVWRSEDAVRVPIGALFRRGDEWQVYRVVDGTARQTPVEIGQRNNQWAEVLGGLSADDQVVLHPSDSVTDGVRVEAY